MQKMRRPHRVSVGMLRLVRVAIVVIWLVIIFFAQPGKTLMIIPMAVFVLFFVLSMTIKEE